MITGQQMGDDMARNNPLGQFRKSLSNYAKTAITQWLYIDTEIIKKLYLFLLRFCSDTFEPYPTFFNTRVGEILKFTGLHKFDLLAVLNHR